MALQPSLGHYYAQINQEWRKGYEVETSRTGRYLSGPLLSHVVVVSVSGGYNDYQVSKCHQLYYIRLVEIWAWELVNFVFRGKLFYFGII